MPTSDPFHDPVAGAATERRVAVLERRIARERRIREEAERIAERVSRELFDKHEGVLMLASVAKSFNQSETVEEALEVAINCVCAHTGWPLGHAYLRDRASGVIRPTGIWHPKHPTRFRTFRDVTASTTFSSGVGLPGRIVESGLPLWIPDVMDDDNFPRAKVAADLGVHAAFGFPILVGDDVVGVLEFFSPRAAEPDQPLLELMAQIGTQLGWVFERERSRAELARQATHDALTGLPNRALLFEQLRLTLARQRREPDRLVAVFFIDVDGFKRVNDSLGHAVGDRVLPEAPTRIQAALRPSDTLGRLSGDEFLVICPDIVDERDAATIAERLIDALRPPFAVEGEEFAVSASIGVTLADGEVQTTPEALINNADAAMYRAKDLGGARWEIFGDELRLQIAGRLQYEGALRSAVESDELRLVYQPEVELATGRIAGMEALLRWQRGEQTIGPSEFIPVAEESGIIHAIGAWALDRACEQADRWYRRLGERCPWFAVNLSVRQLLDPAIVETVATALRKHPAAARRLSLEVTESVLLDDAELGLAALTQLKELGIQIAIDDFGTGYASLSYLRRFPAGMLKIDRCFIAGVDREHTDHAIVAAIVEMAHALGLIVVAEGVEAVAQAHTLRQIGCDLAQGYFFSTPVPAAEIGGLLDREAPYAGLLDRVTAVGALVA